MIPDARQRWADRMDLLVVSSSLRQACRILERMGRLEQAQAVRVVAQQVDDELRIPSHTDYLYEHGDERRQT